MNDPKAMIFYGMALPDDTNIECLNWEANYEKETGCKLELSGCCHYGRLKYAAIAVISTYEETKFFNKIPKNILATTGLIKSEAITEYYLKERIKKACKAYDIEYNESSCGWFFGSYYG